MAAVVLAVLALIAGCYFAGAVVLPTVVAVFLAMLVAPLMRLMMRGGLGRGWSSFLAVVAALAVIFLAVFGCWRAVSGVAQQAPRYQSELKQAAAKVQTRLNRLRRTTQKLAPQVGGGGSAQAGGQGAAPSGEKESGGGVAWSTILLRGLGSLVEAIGLAIFVPFLSLFLLLEEEPLARAFDRAAGPRFDAARLRRDAPKMARAYVFGNVMLALALAVVQTGLFLAFGLDNAIGLGLVTGFLNVIPILGAPVAVILPVLQGLGKLHGAGPFLAIAGGITCIHLFAANWIIPRWIGVHVKVNSTAATLAMLFFSWLWGLTGFLMAVPLAAFVKIALECSESARSLAPLIASHEEELEAAEERRSDGRPSGPRSGQSRWRFWSRRRGAPAPRARA